MRIVFRTGALGAVVLGAAVSSATVALSLCAATDAALAQVINGEGNFESNRGFDRSPEEAASADRPANPADRETRPDVPKPR